MELSTTYQERLLEEMAFHIKFDNLGYLDI